MGEQTKALGIEIFKYNLFLTSSILKISYCAMKNCSDVCPAAKQKPIHIHTCSLLSMEKLNHRLFRVIQAFTLVLLPVLLSTYTCVFKNNNQLVIVNIYVQRPYEAVWRNAKETAGRQMAPCNIHNKMSCSALPYLGIKHSICNALYAFAQVQGFFPLIGPEVPWQQTP